ncbi:hypothetical protein [Pseudoteredinibacter isoporae]|uniref:Glucose dehydrogenase n=1 Tax=Pseudoteredinibacter isoporae TaxID=570281 RepID=A0A7X0JUB9_9GAMM|nr:hypothetical protein [Pseudoteredinibacter isoporae]MBB6522384.1 glucose dehydrogenase [Pseudoteredinibacter isoporae]NHO87917.1 hypothetical protein [Pseudoteredinibacter isoporae]NIB23752.1 hypothetical protein [Pseudoteredinibacter isoporae]
MLALIKPQKLFLKTAALSLLLVTGIAMGQQQDNSSAQDGKDSAAEQKKQSTAKTKTNDKAKAKTKKNNERFVPTEEISEDLPVAFPVDI